MVSGKIASASYAPKFDAFVFNANLDVARVCEHFESLGFSLIQHSSTLGYRYAYLLGIRRHKPWFNSVWR